MILDVAAIRDQKKYEGYYNRSKRAVAIRSAVVDLLKTSPHFVRATPSGSYVYMKCLKVLLSPHGQSFTLEHYQGDTKKNYDRLSNWETYMGYVNTLELRGNLLVVNGLTAFQIG